MNAPVVFSSTYRAGGQRTYGRFGGPTQEAFESALGALEGGACVAFASGLAAVVAVMETLPAGARVVAPHSLYWGVREVLDHRVEGGRLASAYVDITDTEATLAACDGAALLWLPAPKHPPPRAAAPRPARRRGGPARAARRRAGARRPDRRRQHVRHTAPPAPAGARRGRGRAQRDEVPGR